MNESYGIKGVVFNYRIKVIDEYNYLKYISSNMIYREWDINLGNFD